MLTILVLTFLFQLDMLDNKDMWQKLSEENLKYIQSWDWPLKVELIVDYFKSICVDNNIRF